MATIRPRLKLSRTLALLSDLKNGESLILGDDDVLSGKVLCQSRCLELARCVQVPLARPKRTGPRT